MSATALPWLLLSKKIPDLAKAILFGPMLVIPTSALVIALFVFRDDIRATENKFNFILMIAINLLSSVSLGILYFLAESYRYVDLASRIHHVTIIAVFSFFVSFLSLSVRTAFMLEPNEFRRRVFTTFILLFPVIGVFLINFTSTKKI
ncbi:MAG: hypothetical protein R3C60_10115 [Parvularculaceae bacterium]